MTHQYRIYPKDPAAHLFEVQLRVANPDPDGQVFAMPAWISGSYMIRDYARNVVAIRAESGGVDVLLEKIDKSTWKAAKTNRALTLIAEVFAYDPSVRGSHLDNTHAYFNGSCVFPSVVSQESESCELEVAAPDTPSADNWRVVSSMNRKNAKPYGFGTYQADNYAELVDHPFEIGELAIGEFEVQGIPHAIAIHGRNRCDIARLCRDLKTLCTQHLSFLGKPADLDRYVFLLQAPGSGYGGLEHRWSSSLVCDRDNLPFKGQTEIDDAYRTFLGLASHEYFHLWNVKRIRPAAFASTDFAAEAYTRLLWVFEGITSYYDDLQLYRSGLITEQSYLELLGRAITRVRRGLGRVRQSVAESSFDAWIKFYKQDANANNSIVSYYAKGSLIALCLDLKLRIVTDGQTSLDDVMRECWQRYGDSPDGMPEHGFETLCDEVSGVNLGDFFNATVRGTGELPLEALLESHGILLKTRAATDRADKGGTGPDPNKVVAITIGAKLREKNGVSIFSSVENGGPAERAGIAPGDQAVALDGLLLTAANIDRRLRAYRAGDTIDIDVFRGDEMQRLEICLAAAADDTVYLLRDDDAGADAKTRRDAWLAR